MLTHFRRHIFGLSLEETTFARRGFHEGEAGARQRLELIGRTFLYGYHAALEEDRLDALVSRLSAVEVELRGFAFEGASMALALFDLLMPWQSVRVSTFLNGPGEAHRYMVHVGVGWALARLGRIKRTIERLDPLLRWLAIDGYGFHEGYFHWKGYIQEQVQPTRLSGYARRAFDQGLGRSLWFVDGADVARISATIAAFSPARQADLWSGVGLACAYAGGVDRAAVEVLRALSGSYLPHLAQGAAFAAKARQRAGNLTLHTEVACEILCGISANDAANCTDLALEDLPTDGAQPLYEIWRQRIQSHFEKEAVTT
jgi:enediyne biosynthesis protein E3